MINDAAKKFYADREAPAFSLMPPERQELGDYACNIAMVLAKATKKNPMEIAAELAEDLKKNAQGLIRSIHVAPPGFINIIICDSALLAAASDALECPSAWGRGQEGKGKTVVIDYFQLNIAKLPHVGHLRSAVIGDALKRMLHARGYYVVSDTHVGDWGTQFGILLYAYKKAVTDDDMLKEAIQKNPFEKLQELYTSANAEEDVHELGKAEFAKLEQGDKENRKIWEWMVDISMPPINPLAELISKYVNFKKMGIALRW